MITTGSGSFIFPPLVSTPNLSKPDDGQQTKDSSQEATVDTFLKYAKMSPVERLRAQYLEAHNLTESSLKALPPEEREKIEQEIARRIEEQFGGEAGQSAGLVVDQLA